MKWRVNRFVEFFLLSESQSVPSSEERLWKVSETEFGVVSGGNGVGILDAGLDGQDVGSAIGAVAEDDSVQVEPGGGDRVFAEDRLVLRHGAAGAEVSQDLQAARAFAELELVGHGADTTDVRHRNIRDFSVFVSKRSRRDHFADDRDRNRSKVLQRRLRIGLVSGMSGIEQPIEAVEIGRNRRKNGGHDARILSLRRVLRFRTRPRGDLKPLRLCDRGTAAWLRG